MKRRAMASCALGSLLFGLGCSDSVGGGEGTVTFTTWGEDYIEAEIPAADFRRLFDPLSSSSSRLATSSSPMPTAPSPLSTTASASSIRSREGRKGARVVRRPRGRVIHRGELHALARSDGRHQFHWGGPPRTTFRRWSTVGVTSTWRGRSPKATTSGRGSSEEPGSLPGAAFRYVALLGLRRRVAVRIARGCVSLA